MRIFNAFPVLLLAAVYLWGGSVGDAAAQPANDAVRAVRPGRARAGSRRRRFSPANGQRNRPSMDGRVRSAGRHRCRTPRGGNAFFSARFRRSRAAQVGDARDDFRIGLDHESIRYHVVGDGGRGGPHAAYRFGRRSSSVLARAWWRHSQRHARAVGDAHFQLAAHARRQGAATGVEQASGHPVAGDVVRPLSARHQEPVFERGRRRARLCDRQSRRTSADRRMARTILGATGDARHVFRNPAASCAPSLRRDTVRRASPCRTIRPAVGRRAGD